MPPEPGRELEVLREIAVAVSSTLDGNEILEIVRDGARSLFGADYVALVVAGPGRADRPLLRDSRGEPVAPVLAELARGVIRSAESRVARDLPPDGETAGAGELRAALGAPLRHAGGAYGVLLAGWRDPEGIGAGTVEVAETLGVYTAAALHNARLHEELKRSTQARDRFFSAMSHDLRTPIAAIVGYSELLADGIVGGLEERQQEMVERIAQVAAHLTELVNDILDVAKLDAGRLELHPRPVVLGKSVEEAVREVEPLARARRLPLVVELGAAAEETVVADPGRMGLILATLLSNAVKFTEEGEVRVLAGMHGSRAWVSVRDTGPGLPAGSEEGVFEELPLFVGGRAEEEDRGSGVGLAVSRRLARAMGGDLTVESTPGVGAAFTLFLPLGRR